MSGRGGHGTTRRVEIERAVDARMRSRHAAERPPVESRSDVETTSSRLLGDGHFAARQRYLRRWVERLAAWTRDARRGVTQSRDRVDAFAEQHKIGRRLGDVRLAAIVERAIPIDPQRVACQADRPRLTVAADDRLRREAGRVRRAPLFGRQAAQGDRAVRANDDLSRPGSAVDELAVSVRERCQRDRTGSGSGWGLTRRAGWPLGSKRSLRSLLTGRPPRSCGTGRAALAGWPPHVPIDRSEHPGRAARARRDEVDYA